MPNQLAGSPKYFAKLHLVIQQQLQLTVKDVTIDLDSGRVGVESLELGTMGFSQGAPKPTATFSATVPRDGFEFVESADATSGPYYNFDFIAANSHVPMTAWIQKLTVKQSTSTAITADFSIHAIGNPKWSSLTP